jgi:hypothetical protein
MPLFDPVAVGGESAKFCATAPPRPRCRPDLPRFRLSRSRLTGGQLNRIDQLGGRSGSVPGGLLIDAWLMRAPRQDGWPPRVRILCLQFFGLLRRSRHPPDCSRRSCLPLNMAVHPFGARKPRSAGVIRAAWRRSRYQSRTGRYYQTARRGLPQLSSARPPSRRMKDD